MRLKSGHHLAGLILQLLLLVAFIKYRGPVLLAGFLYLIVANYLDLFAAFVATRVRKQQMRGNPDPTTWLLNTRAYVLFLSAWQVAIVGFLNMWPFEFSDSRLSAILGYLLAGIFVIVSYGFVAIADSSEQEGGSRPLNFFGRPRSRRLVFCALIYSPIGPLVILSTVWSDAKWCPTLLRAPQFWLLLTALLSAVTAALLFQRYLRSGPNKTSAMRVLIGTLSILGLEAAIQLMFTYSTYVYVLSSITLACIAASVYWLSLAREANTGRSPQVQVP